MKKLLLILLLLMEICIANAQIKYWKNYTLTSTIQELAENDKYIWACPELGGVVKINKITGESYIYNKTNSGLPQNNITSIKCDSAGVVWMISTSSGPKGIGGPNSLTRFDGQNWKNYEIPDSTQDPEWDFNSISHLVISSDNNIWLFNNTDDRLLKFDGISWKIDTVPFDYAKMKIDSTDNLWFATWKDGLFKYDGTDWINYNYLNSEMPFSEINDFEIDFDGNIWLLGGEEGLAKFDGKEWNVFNTWNCELSNFGEGNITVDRSGALWIGANRFGHNVEGLWMLDSAGCTTWNSFNSGLPSDVITEILIDEQNNKWIGTKNGLVKYDGKEWTAIKTSDIEFPQINSITFDENANTWIGSNTAVAKFDGEQWIDFDFSDSGLSEFQISNVAAGKNNLLWILLKVPNLLYSNKTAVVTFNGTKWETPDFFNLTNDSIVLMESDANNNIWFVKRSDSYKFSLIKFDGIEWSSIEIPYNLTTPEALRTDDKGTVWILSSQGLTSYDGSKWNTYSFLNLDFTIKNPQISITPEGGAWIITKNKEWLIKFDGKNWITELEIEDLDLMRNHFPNSIIADEMGIIWLGYSGGFGGGRGWLVKYDEYTGTLKKYNTTNSGLPFDNVLYMKKQNNNSLWIATENGLSVFNYKSKDLKANIPDTAFYNTLIDKGVDLNGDGLISLGEAELIHTLDISGKGISDLTGISAFANLINLNCSNNNLSSIDIRRNVQLETFNCSNNQILKLDVSKNTLLQDFNSSFNLLETLNVALNKNLHSLDCSGNQVISIDLTSNKKLRELKFSGNPVSYLNISHNNMINTLELKDNTNLGEVCVWTDEFPFEDLVLVTTGSSTLYFSTTCSYHDVYIPDTAFYYRLLEQKIDTNRDSIISYQEAEAVTSLELGGYANSGGHCFKSTNITDLTGLEAFINLEYLDCSCGYVDSLDLSLLKKLEFLNCMGHNLRYLNISKNLVLKEILCSSNQLESLNLKNNIYLDSLSCINNQITAIDLSENINLTYLNIDGNPLKELDLSNNLNLEYLVLGYNQIKTLDISHNTKLEELILRNLPELTTICVWQMPFPPPGVSAYLSGSPNAFFTDQCFTYLSEWKNQQLKIYPNPASKIINIEYDKQFLVELKSLNGQILYNNSSMVNQHQIDLSEFPAGVYILCIIENNSFYHFKIVKP